MGQVRSQRGGGSRAASPLPKPQYNFFLKSTYFVETMTSNFRTINHSAEISRLNRQQVASTYTLQRMK